MSNSPTGGSNQSGENANNSFGGFSSNKELVDAVVYWIPKLTALFFSKHQGKYNAWTSASELASGAPQIINESETSEQAVISEWSGLSQSKRSTILQYMLSYRSGGPACARKYVRSYSNCDEVVRYRGVSYCKRRGGVDSDICDQASAPQVCKSIISKWKGIGNCDSLPDPVADRFFSWLTAKVILNKDDIKNKKLSDFYFNGVPTRRKK